LLYAIQNKRFRWGQTVLHDEPWHAVWACTLAVAKSSVSQ
jgi:hypothetical protein